MCEVFDAYIWGHKRAKDILDAPYFHIVFTLPKELHTLIYQNQKLLYDLMFKLSAETIFNLCQDKKHLGAEPGFFSVLHTWAQDLNYHPHIHIIIAGGGLTKDKKWLSSSKDFFIPVKVIGKKFRGKFLSHLKSLFENAKLKVLW